MNRRSFMSRAIGTGLSIGFSLESTRDGAHAMASASGSWARRRRFVDTASGRIAVVEQGRGPAVLLLHGFPLSSYQWRGVIDQLQATRRCIAPDFLGLGYTEPNLHADVSPAGQVSMLIQLLDTLHVASVDIIANDSGAGVAQLLIARAPGRVRTVLLTNGDTEEDSPPAALGPVIELAKAGRYADEWLVPWVDDPALARSSQGLGGLCYSKAGFPSDEALVQYLKPLVSSANRKALVHRYTAALEPNSLLGVSRFLAAFEGSVSIVWGDADPIFSRESPEYLASVFKHVRSIRRLPSAKLFFPEEYPEVIAAEARRLWGVSTHLPSE